MTLSNRLWILTGSPFLIVMLIFVVIYLVDIPFANVSWVLIVTGWLVLFLGLIALTAQCVEWVKKYLLLKQLGLLVPRIGFRWWALLAWVAAGIIFNGMLTLLLALNRLAEQPALFSAALSILNLLGALWTLAGLPGMVVTTLYVRRVNKAYEALQFKLAPPHPHLGKPEGE